MMKGTVTHQESFLNRIAERLGRERRKSGVSLPEWKYQPQYQTHAGCTEDDLVTMLKDHCVNIHTELIETDAAGLYDALRTQVNRFEGGPVIIPKDSRFETYGLQTLMTEEWPDEGFPFGNGTRNKERKILKKRNKRMWALHSARSRLRNQPPSFCMRQSMPAVLSACFRPPISPSSRNLPLCRE